MCWDKLQLAASIAGLVVLAAGTAGMAVWTAQDLRPNTPNGALRALAKAFSDGDGRKFANGLHLTIDDSTAATPGWKTTIENVVTAQGTLRKAATTRFGANAVSNAMPIWHSLDEIAIRLTQADDRVQGQRARFPLPLLGRTFPDVPLMVRTNHQWKLAIDLHFVGGQKIGGGHNNTLGMSIQGNGLHLSFATTSQFDADKAQKKFENWAVALTIIAADLRRGRFASAEEAWENCAKALEDVRE